LSDRTLSRILYLGGVDLRKQSGHTREVLSADPFDDADAAQALSLVRHHPALSDSNGTCNGHVYESLTRCGIRPVIDPDGSDGSADQTHPWRVCGTAPILGAMDSIVAHSDA